MSGGGDAEPWTTTRTNTHQRLIGVCIWLRCQQDLGPGLVLDALRAWGKPVELHDDTKDRRVWQKGGGFCTGKEMDTTTPLLKGRTEDEDIKTLL